MKLPPIEYSAIEEKEHHVFFRLRIKPTEKDSNILLKIKNTSDNYIFKFLNFKLFESPDAGNISFLSVRKRRAHDVGDFGGGP